MNKTANRQVICDVLMEHAVYDKDVVVLCSDSRGSASLTQFANTYPQQFVEVGIAEQDLVSIGAGLAACGKKAYAASPACFLSTRSMEQARVDVAYSNTNVKLIGISGGVSYGALGMTHHSAQDIAIMGSIPNMRVYLPSDRLQTRLLMEHLLQDEKPAYLRVGRNAVPDVYEETHTPFVMDEAVTVCAGDDITLIACGEMVKIAQDTCALLQEQGVSCRVLDMYCVKPLDTQAVLAAARETKAIVTLEEHSIIGGLGSLVCQVVAQNCPCAVKCMALPDCAPIAGVSQEVFQYYGLEKANIANVCLKLLGHQ
ncbi:MAG: transketolase C-terminal domain-containing protein [Ruthenibacterium sp.]